MHSPSPHPFASRRRNRKMNRRISFSKVCKFALPLTLGSFIACSDDNSVAGGTEWTTLFNTVGGADIASKMLRSRGGWDLNINTDFVEDKDEFCFSGLPSGVYPYGAEGVHGYFYGSTTIRCIKDEE